MGCLCAGEPYEIKKAVCLHEEDAGIIWKHTELRTMHPEVRRGRRLVISFIATVGEGPFCFVCMQLYLCISTLPYGCTAYTP